jgi:hypothetical protein
LTIQYDRDYDSLFTSEERLEQTKRPTRVTRFGKPVAGVVPSSPSKKSREWLGSMTDTIGITGDIVSPVIEESDWDALRE